ncbi:tripartite tricarboxylate transporter substrate binding protein [Bordetella pseudohinzii]|nr:tripartite tricarboxylate transporter substrate binding protein [Bordetella pseudohinzii]ANY16206.1 ABC transporter substrate-binding protein [Bordetella pseudohinzii]KMM25302.1 ABC transporter substrate-binding protein [Bordetella pseudohinzii]KXA78661.1 ABC transporter substrate-binding protein [Bordetella pseudohinzii]KXA81194.1 ABC transporter substrate-binding protein [Bordetella pseudohinzii]
MKRLLGLLAFSALMAGSAHAAYPDKPVSLMVPYPAGAASDITARAIQAPLSRALGATVIVENLGGANGSLGANRVLNAPADGLYIFQGSPNELVLAGLTNSAVRYKPEDFVFLNAVASSPYVVVTRKDIPAANIDELAALARKADIPMTYASGGVGSMIHLISLDFEQRAKARLTHIPYRGGGQILPDLIGGQVDFAIIPYQANYQDLRREGKIKVIATLNAERLAAMPDVPSVSESVGMKDFNYNIWTAYLVKRGTPEAIVRRLHGEIDAALQDAEFRKTMDQQGKIMYPSASLEAAQAFYASEIERLRKLVLSINFKGE